MTTACPQCGDPGAPCQTQDCGANGQLVCQNQACGIVHYSTASSHD